MSDPGKFDFAAEIAGILPVFLREVIRSHEMIGLEKELSHAAIAIIDLLTEQGACKMSRIALALNLTMGAVTGIIDKMVKSRLVERERSCRDRRVVNVTLLKKGKETAKRVNEIRRNLTDELYAVLSEEEKKTYVKLLKKVYKDLEKRQ